MSQMNKLTPSVNYTHKPARKQPSAATLLLLKILGLLTVPGGSGRLFQSNFQRDPFPTARRHRRYKPSHHRR